MHDAARLPVIALTMLAALASLAPVEAGASLLDVQFSGGFPTQNPRQTGAVVVGSATDQWNYFTTATGNGEMLSTVGGAPSGVTLSFSSAFTYAAAPNNFVFAGTPVANLMQGYLVNDIQFQLAGLASGQAYGLYVYTQADNSSLNRSITLASTNAPAQTSVQTNANSFILDNNYLYFQGTADASGSVVVSETAFAGEADVNGFQLVTASVPEPASLAVLATGVAGLAARRGRRAGCASNTRG